MSDRIELNGYSFERDMGLEAKKEQTAIDYLTKQLNMNEPATVLKVYRQIISQKLFHTQVGYDFLKGLQNYLYTNPEIDNSQIEMIEIGTPEELLTAINASKVKRGEKPSAPVEEDRKGGKKERAYKKRSQIFMVTTIVLAAMVIAMFVITLTARVPTVLNYKENLNDYYSQWEQSLTERENALRSSGAGIGN